MNIIRRAHSLNPFSHNCFIDNCYLLKADASFPELASSHFIDIEADMSVFHLIDVNFSKKYVRFFHFFNQIEHVRDYYLKAFLPISNEMDNYQGVFCIHHELVKFCPSL
jgi:hypothetical protein